MAGSKSTRTKWTWEDKRELESLFNQGMNDRAVYNHFNRRYTESSINNRRRRFRSAQAAGPRAAAWRARSYYEWTPQEDEALRTAYSSQSGNRTVDWLAVAIAVGRSPAACQNRVVSLTNYGQLERRPSVKKKPVGAGRHSTIWTEEEDARLLALYEQGRSLLEISRLMNRTYNAINTHVRKVRRRIRRKSPFDPMPAKEAEDEEEEEEEEEAEEEAGDMFDEDYDTDDYEDFVEEDVRPSAGQESLEPFPPRRPQAWDENVRELRTQAAEPFARRASFEPFPPRRPQTWEENVRELRAQAAEPSAATGKSTEPLPSRQSLTGSGLLRELQGLTETNEQYWRTARLAEPGEPLVAGQLEDPRRSPGSVGGPASPGGPQESSSEQAETLNLAAAAMGVFAHQRAPEEVEVREQRGEGTVRQPLGTYPYDLYVDGGFQTRSSDPALRSEKPWEQSKSDEERNEGP